MYPEDRLWLLCAAINVPSTVVAMVSDILHALRTQHYL
jgi:hypothetical protein